MYVHVYDSLLPHKQVTVVEGRAPLSGSVVSHARWPSLRIRAWGFGTRVYGFGLKTRFNETECLNDNLLVRIHFIIVMIGWTSLAPWDFEFLLLNLNLNSLFQ